MEELMRHLFLKNMKNKITYFYLIISSVFYLNNSFATNYLENQAWFHPYDPSLKHIAKILTQAKSSIDIAMYSMSISSQSPVIKSLLSKNTQERIHNSNLKIRLIFQGYETGDKRIEQLQKLEDMGIDVRYFANTKKLHHKFAVIDGNSLSPRLITGSANWSLSSYKNYNDNILYFASSPLLSKTYQEEFNLLWTYAKKFGKEQTTTPPLSLLKTTSTEPGIKSYFNSENLKKPTKNKKKIHASDYILTHQIVQGINQAKDTIDIATTRIKLFPVYKALLKAADRGVKINIVVTMAQYTSWYKRNRGSLKNCKDDYQAHCSVGVKYSSLLEKNSLKQSNIQVRVKYFDLRPLESIKNQMHHKYMIIDNQHVLTGSFNWSFSSEFQHIENLLSIQKTDYPYIVKQFQKDFQTLWVPYNKDFNAFYFKLKENLKYKKKFNCHFKPLILSFSQIDKMRQLVSKYKRANKIKDLNLCL